MKKLVHPITRNAELHSLLQQAAAHPIRTLRMLNFTRVRNFLCLIFGRPEVSSPVFWDYQERLTAEEPVLRFALQTLTSAEGLLFDNPSNPTVSVIIPVHNQLEYTLRCLRSIMENLPACPIELIVADDCSSDETQEVVSQIPGIVYVRNEENLQSLRSVNNAARYARGDYLFPLKNDTEVLPGWLDVLLEAFREHPKAGVVGSRLIYPDGRLQEAGRIIWSDASSLSYGRLDDPEKPEYSYLKEVDYVSGTALMVKRDLFKSLGGFDERFPPTCYEDADLCFRARERGHKVFLQPRSNVIHFEGISHGTDVNRNIKRFQQVAQKKFAEKWHEVLSADHYPNAKCVFLARDRSKDKRTILVIDHYVPRYDRDAGSRSTLCYLKLFVSKGFNIKFLGDNFLRQEPYTSRLQELGIEVLYGNHYDRNWCKWITENASSIDVIYLHRPHIAEKYLDCIAGLNPRPKTIYFGHDLHYLRLGRQAELEDSDELRHESAVWRARENKIFESVDLVYYPSEVEIREIKSHRADANAKSIPLYVFDEPWEGTYQPEERADILFIGGFDHLPNVDGIRWFVDIFTKAQPSLGEVVLHVVGSRMPAEVRAFASDHIVTHGYLPDDEVDELYRRVRLSVVPLRYGAGIKGKVLESMHKGVPVLTTGIGAEGVVDADRGLYVSSLEGFDTSLVSIYGDFDKLKELSILGQKIVSLHYSVEAAEKAVVGDFL